MYDVCSNCKFCKVYKDNKELEYFCEIRLINFTKNKINYLTKDYYDFNNDYCSCKEFTIKFEREQYIVVDASDSLGFKWLKIFKNREFDYHSTVLGSNDLDVLIDHIKKLLKAERVKKLSDQNYQLSLF